MKYMEELRNYIKEREAFNHSYLARASQWDKLDFSHWIHNKTDVIPERVIKKLTQVLSRYGYIEN